MSKKCQFTLNERMMVLIQNDITNEDSDAIVNAANTSLRGGRGVDGAIHAKGGKSILYECISRYPEGCPTGECRITTGGSLKAHYVIHCVGPVYFDGHCNEDRLLETCYLNALTIATNYQLRSIAFPSISTGAYHYPFEKACRIAIHTIKHFFVTHPRSSLHEIRLVTYSAVDYSNYLAILQQEIV